VHRADFLGGAARDAGYARQRAWALPERHRELHSDVPLPFADVFVFLSF
jgi:hypothetical protein